MCDTIPIGTFILANKQGLRFVVSQESKILGRGTSADLIVNSKSISRLHAKISLDSDSRDAPVKIEDLGSLNGSFIGDGRIVIGYAATGDVVRFGKMEFKVNAYEAVDDESEDDEQIVDRVAAIDVAKASGMVCTRVPHASIPGRRITRVWEVSSTTNAIIALAGHLVEAGIERVVVESTSDYWRPFVYLFQTAGLTTWLVNARDVKQVPGRPKTDKIDAVWLAKLNERGMLRASFIPPVEIRQLRDYTRCATT